MKSNFSTYKMSYHNVKVSYISLKSNLLYQLFAYFRISVNCVVLEELNVPNMDKNIDRLLSAEHLLWSVIIYIYFFF